MDARLALRTAEERARALHGRADQLLRAAQAEREARARAAERRERLIREGRAAEAVGVGVGVVLGRLEVSIAPRRRGPHRGRAGPRGPRAASCSPSAPRCATWPASTTSWSTPSTATRWPAPSSGCGSSSSRSGRSRSSASTPTALVADYGPDQLGPRSSRRGRGGRRDARARRRTSARSSRSGCAPPSARSPMLGRVNPLALEEFSAMEERHKFLTEQLEDLKQDPQGPARHRPRGRRPGRAGLHRGVRRRAARPSTRRFARLFPGGEGRLVLTDPDDMLNTGIEVEARPPGKKVKRLSLLSGGERSLVAVAFLVALFKARPSPFYILDEVEAALDDTNLGRLLEIYEELRENSQLLVITHQKRTMEVGDALYGVTMRGDGVSTVISQRLREAEPPDRLRRRRASRMADRDRPTRDDYVALAQRVTTRWARRRRLRAHEQRPLLRADRHRRQRPPRRGHRRRHPRACPRSAWSPRSLPLLRARSAIPEPVDVGVVVDKVGRSSVIYRVGLFQGRRPTRRPPRAGSCTCTSTTRDAGDRPVVADPGRDPRGGRAPAAALTRTPCRPVASDRGTIDSVDSHSE